MVTALPTPPRELTERDENGKALGIVFGDPDNGGRGARLYKADGAFVVDLHEPGQPVRRFARRTGFVRLRRMARRWAADVRRMCRVVVFVDGARAGSFKTLEGSDAARDIEAYLPGWRITSPVWIVPYDERAAAYFPANVVSVRVTAGEPPEDAGIRGS